MEKKTDEKKINAILSNVLQKSTEVGKKVAKTTADVTKTTVEKIKEANEAHQREKLNPLFQKEYKSKSFNIPNIIKIVDDAERRSFPICEGAIGWRQFEGKTEVLYLYDEVEKISGLEFVPTFSCNAVYCVDPFNRKRFIKADCIFSKTQEEKLAELENIAYCLGAKSCSIEIIALKTQRKSVTSSVSLGIKQLSVSTENNLINASAEGNAGKTIVQFQGHDRPTAPILKWFTYDDTIKNLIDMRCKDPASIKSRVLELSGSSSATMSQQTAVAIDAVLKNAKIKRFINQNHTILS